MAKKLAYERYNWFHAQIKAGRYPNARKLSEEFELSEKQAQREIEFIRDRLGAPLFYDPARKGYEYEDDTYELPPVWYKEDELLALCLALRLASTLPDLKLKDSLHELLGKFLTFRSLNSHVNLEEIQEKVSVKNVEYYRVNETIFHKVVDSLFLNEALKIYYHTPPKCFKDEVLLLKPSGRRWFEVKLPLWYVLRNREEIKGITFCDVDYDSKLGATFKKDELLPSMII